MGKSPADSQSYSLLLEHFRLGRGIAPNQADGSTQDVIHTYHAIHERCRHREVAVSKTGFLPVVPKVIQPGYIITDLNGGLFSFFLRSRNGEYQIINELTSKTEKELEPVVCTDSRENQFVLILLLFSAEGPIRTYTLAIYGGLSAF